jgi:hypothetical protein
MSKNLKDAVLKVVADEKIGGNVPLIERKM